MISGVRQRRWSGDRNRRRAMQHDGSPAEAASTRAGSTPAVDPRWLEEVADAAADDAGAPAELLGRYLWVLADAAVRGSGPGPDDLLLVAASGRRAARQGVAPGQGVNLYLSGARRLWGELPLVVRSSDSEVVRAAADAVLHVVGEAVRRLESDAVLVAVGPRSGVPGAVAT